MVAPLFPRQQNEEEELHMELEELNAYSAELRQVEARDARGQLEIDVPHAAAT